MISVIMPSAGRPQLLRVALKSLRDTTQDNAVQVIAVVDASRESLAAALDYCDIAIYRPELGGALSGWNVGAAVAAGDYLVLAADDLVFGRGWLDEALAVMEDALDGYGMVGFNDMSPNAQGRGTHYMVSRDYAVDCWGGVLVVPHYHHNYIDWEAQKRAEADGCYAWAEKAHVHHNHFDWDKARFDETYARSRAGLDGDRNLYYQREAAGFPNDYPAAFGRLS